MESRKLSDKEKILYKGWYDSTVEQLSKPLGEWGSYNMINMISKRFSLSILMYRTIRPANSISELASIELGDPAVEDIIAWKHEGDIQWLCEWMYAVLLLEENTVYTVDRLSEWICAIGKVVRTTAIRKEFNDKTYYSEKNNMPIYHLFQNDGDVKYYIECSEVTFKLLIRKLQFFGNINYIHINDISEMKNKIRGRKFVYHYYPEYSLGVDKGTNQILGDSKNAEAQKRMKLLRRNCVRFTALNLTIGGSAIVKLPKGMTMMIIDGCRARESIITHGRGSNHINLIDLEKSREFHLRKSDQLGNLFYADKPTLIKDFSTDVHPAASLIYGDDVVYSFPDPSKTIITINDLSVYLTYLGFVKQPPLRTNNHLRMLTYITDDRIGKKLGKFYRHASIFVTQGGFQREAARILRESIRGSKNTMYDLRRMMELPKGYEIIETTGITAMKGDSQFNGSGHMFNWFVNSIYMPLDWKRIIVAIESNIRMQLVGYKGLKNEYNEMRSKGLIGELLIGEKDKLWHTYMEFKLGAELAELFLPTIYPKNDLIIPNAKILASHDFKGYIHRCVKYVMSELHKLRRYKIFDDQDKVKRGKVTIRFE